MRCAPTTQLGYITAALYETDRPQVAHLAPGAVKALKSRKLMAYIATHLDAFLSPLIVHAYSTWYLPLYS